jgi:hypothetical protein
LFGFWKRKKEPKATCSHHLHLRAYTFGKKEQAACGFMAIWEIHEICCWCHKSVNVVGFTKKQEGINRWSGMEYVTNPRTGERERKLVIGGYYKD